MSQGLIVNSGQPGPIAAPFDRGMQTLPTLWGRLRNGLVTGRRSLEAAVAEAESIDSALVDEVRSMGQVASGAELKTFLRMLVSAWPNASQNDLAGYGLQLSQDVEDQRPSRYALRESSRCLRRTSRFLPSISEVLDVIAMADKKMAAVLKTLDQIPVALAQAKDELGRGALY